MGQSISQFTEQELQDYQVPDLSASNYVSYKSIDITLSFFPGLDLLYEEGNTTVSTLQQNDYSQFL